MEVIPGSSGAFLCTKSPPNLTFFSSQVLLFQPYLEKKKKKKKKKARCLVCCYLSSNEQSTPNCFPAPSARNGDKRFTQLFDCLDKGLVLRCSLFVPKTKCIPRLTNSAVSTLKSLQSVARFHNLVPAFYVHIFVLGMMFVMTLGATVTKPPALALSEENLLFLEAWRTLDRAYIDKTFNGQSWFRYRENALRKEPMNTREETYAAIRKMVSTLDDPFTRFLEPKKFKSLRSGTRNSLTGVGISIGYPAGKDKMTSGLVVVSAAPGGPANRAGVLSGDLILAIDDMSTESMEIYDAAERLQGPEGSRVELIVRHGSETNRFSLVREKVSLNPVRSRVCRTSSVGDGGPLVGYIKLTSFNQNASGALREAIEKLRGNNVNAFILDLRDNSGGLFPEGVEIAKIWLDKGVIVYICDSRGVRDIYDIDGTNATAASEPLIVLVNKGTASASEILAGALKDNKRAVVLGEPTYGKGKIQSVFELSDGSGMAVTVARYETPAHTDIDKVGVIPDHPLPVLFPKDEESLCGCLVDRTSACYLNRVGLFSR